MRIIRKYFRTKAQKILSAKSQEKKIPKLKKDLPNQGKKGLQSTKYSELKKEFCLIYNNQNIKCEEQRRNFKKLQGEKFK